MPMHGCHSIFAMAGMHCDAEVLKQDASGRMRTPPERRNELLDEFERSGLSGPKFAALVGVKYPTLAGWVIRRKRERSGAHPVAPPPPKTGGLHWLEAVVDGPRVPGSPAGNALIIEFPGGARMHIADAHQAELAALVLRATSRPC